tara:strand:+ start:3087 stop:3386 length:300 start_codon:yes stop_codon:yes gene_type:complete
MDIKELQKESVEIVEKSDIKYGKKHDTDTTIIHLTEEIGEVAREIFNEKIGRDKLNRENMGEEIADCIILLNKLADNFNIDVEKAIENKINKLKQRFNS